MTFTRRRFSLVAVALLVTSLNVSFSLADRSDSEAILHDTQWNIVEIANSATDTNFPLPTLHFSTETDFFGKACNSFRGTYTSNGASLSFGAAAATKMACAEPLMRQENALFSAFEHIISYEITNDGMLHLKNKDGSTLIVARPA